VLPGLGGQYPHSRWTLARVLDTEAVEDPSHHLLHTCSHAKDRAWIHSPGAVYLCNLHYLAHAWHSCSLLHTQAHY
jgi:hypothetical protein